MSQHGPTRITRHRIAKYTACIPQCAERMATRWKLRDAPVHAPAAAVASSCRGKRAHGRSWGRLGGPWDVMFHHHLVMRIRVGKTGIVMPRTLPATFEGEADKEAQERPVGAAAPRRDGEQRACRGDGPPRGGLFPDERQESAVGCLRASADRCQRLGVSVRRVAADNGPCCTRPGRSPPRASVSGPGIPDQALHAQDPRCRRASSRRPERERDCARTHETSEQRAADFPAWTRMHDWRRSHSALGSRPPMQPLAVGAGQAIEAPHGAVRAHARPCPPMPAHARHRLFAGFPMLAGAAALSTRQEGGRSGRLASCDLEPNSEDPASKA